MTVTARGAEDGLMPDAGGRPPAMAGLVWAVIIGNALEWYDFIVYGFLASTLAYHFFPPGNESAALLGSYAAFALSFVARPIGGILIGLYSDKVGRGAALVLVMASMTVAMLIMTFTPTYASIGLWATVILIVARLLQALSAGGEFGSAAALLIEMAPPSRRGLYSGLYGSGSYIATIFAALMGLLITQGMSTETLDSWGWRIPFAVGLVIAPIGLYVRLRLGALYTRQDRRGQAGSLRTLFRFNSGRLFVGLAMASIGNAAGYVFLVYAPTYVVRTLNLPSYIPFIGLIVAGLASALLIPVMGGIADRVGRFRFLIGGLGLLMVSVVPLYAWLAANASLGAFMLFMFIVSMISAIQTSVVPEQMSELFDAGVRSTALALCSNVSSMLFGAFSLVLVTYLTQLSGSTLVPGYFVAGTAAFCLVTVLVFNWTKAGRGAAAQGS